MSLAKSKAMSEPAAARFITGEIRSFVATSPLNRMPSLEDSPLFDEPLVNFADGDDPLFKQYKSIIAPTHLSPREALGQALNKRPDELPARLSVISWILPIVANTRQANRREKLIPHRLWSYTRWYGEKFNEALRRHVVEFLSDKGYLATAPVIQSYFKTQSNEKGPYSNWSERHVAYAAGLGTFSLSDGFITERGIAHRCGSVVTDMPLPASPREAHGPYSNCLFYADGKCRACIDRCPPGAITENGHDKIRCQAYHAKELNHVREQYQVGVLGCGLCQVKVPCEFRNPVRQLKKSK